MLGIYDEPTKQVVALPIQDRSTRTLQPIFEDFCAAGSVGTTDEWSGYNFLAGSGFGHFVCCHKDGFKNPLTGKHTNNIERTWRPWKEFVRNLRPIRHYNIPIYLNSWLFRFNLHQAGVSWDGIVDGLIQTMA